MRLSSYAKSWRLILSDEDVFTSAQVRGLLLITCNRDDFRNHGMGGE